MGERENDYYNRVWRREYLNQNNFSSSRNENNEPRHEEQGTQNPGEHNPNSTEPDHNFSLRTSNIHHTSYLANNTDGMDLPEPRPRLSAGGSRPVQIDRVYERFHNHESSSPRLSRTQLTENFYYEPSSPPPPPREPLNYHSHDHNARYDIEEGAPIGFRRRQLAALRESRREYEPQFSWPSSRSQQQDRSERSDRAIEVTSFDSVWRNSIQESVQELRMDEHHRRRREYETRQNLRTAQPTSSQVPDNDVVYIPNWDRINEERGVNRRRERPGTSAAPHPQVPDHIPRSSTSTTPTTVLELHSKYLGEFTFGLVKKENPGITLDQAIRDAEKEVRDSTNKKRTRNSGRRDTTSSGDQRIRERMVLTGISDGISVPSAGRNRTRVSTPSNNNLNINTPITSRNGNDNSMTEPGIISFVPPPPRFERTEIAARAEIRTKELKENLKRLQAVIDQCENNSLDIQQMLTDTKELLEKERKPQTAPPRNTTTSSSTSSDFCLSIWESTTPGETLDTSSPRLPLVEAYVTAIPKGFQNQNQVQSNETERDNNNDSSEESSSSDTDAEYNVWDAHSTMRNFTESTFSIDSDDDDDINTRQPHDVSNLLERTTIHFDDHDNDSFIRLRNGLGRVNRMSARGSDIHHSHSREISPETRQFHRSIGIRDYGEEDNDSNTFSDFIMMPNPRGGNSLGEDEPLPLFPDKLSGGDVLEPPDEDNEEQDDAPGTESDEDEEKSCLEQLRRALSMVFKLKSSSSEESTENEEDGHNVDEKCVEKMDVNKKVDWDSSEESTGDDHEIEEKCEHEDDTVKKIIDWDEEDLNEDKFSKIIDDFTQNTGQTQDMFLQQGQTNNNLDSFDPLVGLFGVPFHGVPPPKVELDQHDIEMERILNDIKHDKTQGVYIKAGTDVKIVDEDLGETVIIKAPEIEVINTVAAQQVVPIKLVPQEPIIEPNLMKSFIIEPTTYNETDFNKTVVDQKILPTEIILKNTILESMDDLVYKELITKESVVNDDPNFKDIKIEKVEETTHGEVDVDFETNTMESNSPSDDIGLTNSLTLPQLIDTTNKKENGLKTFYNKWSTRLSNITKKNVLGKTEKKSSENKFDEFKGKGIGTISTSHVPTSKLNVDIE